MPSLLRIPWISWGWTPAGGAQDRLFEGPQTSSSPIASITKEEPARRGGKINIEIPARLTGLLQRELQPENNSTYSDLACLPSPYVFLFTNDSGKLNVHVTLNWWAQCSDL